LESAKKLVSRTVRHSRNGGWRQKYMESPKNIESEGIRRQRATFGGSELLIGNF
jgi:hypothetical protein